MVQYAKNLKYLKFQKFVRRALLEQLGTVLKKHPKSVFLGKNIVLEKPIELTKSIKAQRVLQKLRFKCYFLYIKKSPPSRYLTLKTYQNLIKMNAKTLELNVLKYFGRAEMRTRCTTPLFQWIVILAQVIKLFAFSSLFVLLARGRQQKKLKSFSW